MASQRRAIALLEVSIATVLVAALMTLFVQVLGVMAAQRRAADQRQVALQQAANVMERCTALAWPEATSDALARIGGEVEQRQGHVGRLSVTLHAPPDDPAAKRITVEIYVPNAAGGERAVARLTAWMYRR
jgi:type II secretory pathway component PulJ